MKIGLFGGSFNPIHYGHLIIAQTVLDAYDLDEIVFIPAYQNPLKINLSHNLDQDRVKMIQLAINENSRFKMNLLEIERGMKSYTIETLEKIKKDYPDKTLFFWIAGSDILPEFYLWKEYEKLKKEIQFIIFNRNQEMDFSKWKKIYPEFVYFDQNITQISATMIRNLLNNGKSIRYLVPEPVRVYIEEKKLYKN